MKVAIASCGRFHSIHLASQLQKYGVLKNIFTSAYSSGDKNYLSDGLVHQFKTCSVLDKLVVKSGILKIINKSSWYVFKDNLFDFWLSHKVKKLDDVDIFVCWAHSFFNSLDRIKSSGAKIIIESGSTHIKYQAGLLESEYKKFGLLRPPINHKNMSKMLSEYQAADFIMTPSNFVKKSFLENGFDQDKILKVPYGVNLSRFATWEKKPAKKFTVLFVGTIGIRKGVYYLLKAWEKLALAENKADLLLVGNIESDFSKILKGLNIKPNVKFLGSVSQAVLSKIYLESSLFVLPSIEEGLSMVIAEAMASSLPVICTTNTGCDELIMDQKEGFIVEVANIDAIAEKILWFYNNSNELISMGEAARAKAAKFSWDVYGENIIKTYNSILKKQ